MCSRRATLVAREHNPATPHTQECVRRATPVRYRHTRGNAFSAQRRATPVAAALADGGDRTHTLLPVLDFESSASANSATSAFCEEATTNPFAMKRKRQRRQPRLILNSCNS
jgi:hypothetical protein